MAPYRFPLFEEISKLKNIDLTVYFMSKSAKNRRWKKLPKLGFKYKILPKLEFSYFGKDLLAYIVNYTFPYLFLKNKYDVVISAGWLDFASQMAFFLSKLTKTKFIIWSESTINEPSIQRKLTLPFVKYLVGKSDACVAIGTRSKEYLKLLGANENKIVKAYSTVDINHFDKGSRLSTDEKNKLKNGLNIKTNKVILYVGQMIERKGLIDLVKAFKLIVKSDRDVTLLMVGYGPLKNKLIEACNKNNLKNVIFVDHVEVDEMPHYYAISDIFVLPSHEETWGLVINEAMACGLPIITTNKVGSGPDLVINGYNGYIVKSRSPKQIALHLLKILKNTKVRISMSRNSKRLIEKFTPKKAALEFEKAIKISMK